VARFAYATVVTIIRRIIRKAKNTARNEPFTTDVKQSKHYEEIRRQINSNTSAN
jgi:hypothetical protein